MEEWSEMHGIAESENEGRATTQGMKAVPRSWEDEEWIPPELQKGKQHCLKLDFNPEQRMLDS